MFLFNASQSENEPHGPITNTIRLFGNKVSVMYDVWAVNAILNAKRDEYDVIAPNAERVFQLWMPMGVLKNEGAPMRNRLGDERFGSRMVNLVVGYRVKTFNIWGGDIDVGTRLFFICKKVPAEANEGNLGHKRSRTRTFGDDASAETQGGKPMVWKIFPYADREHTTPPLHILAYEVDDPRGTKTRVTKFGSYVCVGMASERAVPVSATHDVLERADSILKLFRQSPQRFPAQIEMYVSN
jgi:hypothetical protein